MFMKTTLMFFNYISLSNKSGHVFKYIFHIPDIFEKYLPFSVVMKIFSKISRLNSGSRPRHDPRLLGNDLAVQGEGGGDADQRGGGD